MLKKIIVYACQGSSSLGHIKNLIAHLLIAMWQPRAKNWEINQEFFCLN